MFRPTVHTDDGTQLYALTARGLAALSSVVALCVTMIVLAVVTIASDHRAEDRVCDVQAKGAVAQRHLTHVMGDVLVLLKPYPGEKPMPVPAPVRLVLASFERELSAYARIERAQPQRPVC